MINWYKCGLGLEIYHWNFHMNLGLTLGWWCVLTWRGDLLDKAHFAHVIVLVVIDEALGHGVGVCWHDHGLCRRLVWCSFMPLYILFFNNDDGDSSLLWVLLLCCHYFSLFALKFTEYLLHLMLRLCQFCAKLGGGANLGWEYSILVSIQIAILTQFQIYQQPNILRWC